MSISVKKFYLPWASNCLLRRNIDLPCEGIGPVLSWPSSLTSSSPALVALSRCTTSSPPIVDETAPLVPPPKNFTFLVTSTYPCKPVSLNLNTKPKNCKSYWLPLWSQIRLKKFCIEFNIIVSLKLRVKRRAWRSRCRCSRIWCCCWTLFWFVLWRRVFSEKRSKSPLRFYAAVQELARSRSREDCISMILCSADWLRATNAVDKNNNK